MKDQLFQTQTFKKGTYYIGDLCYIMHKDNLWYDFLAITEQMDSKGRMTYADGFFEFKGYHCGWHGTKYGDGSYHASSRGNINLVGECPVDSGTIGIMPFAFIKMYNTPEEVEAMMTDGIVHIFDKDFDVTLSYDSTFGDIQVFTSEDEDDEDEDNYEDDDDEDNDDDDENKSESE